MSDSMPDFAAQRLNMVESQVRANDVTDTRIQDAMRAVPRERFVPSAKQALAYSDAVIEVLNGRFLLDPRTFAKLAQLARIEPADRILDVGCASGYSTAVLARLGHEASGLEEDAELAQVAAELLPLGGVPAGIVRGPLADGWSKAAPYDIIFINGAVECVSPALEDQLAENGRMVVVIRKGPQGRATLFLREQGRIGCRADFDSGAPVLPGFRKAKAFVF